MSHNSGDESGATNGEGASAQEGQSGGQFGGVKPERRLQELRRLRHQCGLSPWRVPRSVRGTEGVVGLLLFPLVAEWFPYLPYLSTRLSPTQNRDYSVIKETVLDELKLSTGECLKRLLGSGKRANEGWRPFATRLQSYVHFYLDARGCTFEALVELLVADQLKRNLSEEARRYVTLQEGRKWINAPGIATFLRTFEEAQGTNSAAKQVGQKAVESQVSGGFEQGPQPGNRSSAKSLGAEVKSKPRGCYACGASGHQRWNCPARERSQAAKDAGVNSGSLAARVSVEEPAAARGVLIPVSLGCKDINIRAVLDTGAEITMFRESAIPHKPVRPCGQVNLSVWGKGASEARGISAGNVPRA
ncbi:hypothetical protein HPB50_022238 [Hyalomma asiaticum]|uniref:Uncharacterized protein n=1 Tax=Hyalomma asiaticum TaxID=266040 RepID=A0ACB7T4S6_HYAAI|nr:hypothetical protein HPB50_022238 [Hyalomma asiaticum]